MVEKGKMTSNIKGLRILRKIMDVSRKIIIKYSECDKLPKIPLKFNLITKL